MQPNGEVIRQLRITDSIQHKKINHCIELSNGDLLCTGAKSPTHINGNGDLVWWAHWLVRFDSLGQMLWEKTYTPNIFATNVSGTWPFMLRIHNMGDSLFVVGGYKIDSPWVRIWSCFAAFDQNGDPLGTLYSWPQWPSLGA